MDIKKLTLAELTALNQRIVDRIKQLQRTNTLELMNEFNVGDTVCFTLSTGEVINGKIFKFNKKTISIMTNKSTQYNVSPSILSKVAVRKEKNKLKQYQNTNLTDNNIFLN